MTPVSDHKVDAGFLEELLALPTLEQRSAFLRTAGLLNAEGLEQLLDLADRLVHSDPGQAHRLAALCADLADRAAAPTAVPRASYIRGQTHAANGELGSALLMAEAAYAGYMACGKDLEALRTHVGRMSVLLELGHYREALDAGQVVLDALNGPGELAITPTREQSDLLTALVHQNRGGCYEYMGRYEDALGAYGVAEERYRALGMTERLGEILDNRGAILLLLGRGKEALAAHEAAAAVFAAAGLTLSHAKALSNIGEANRQLADYRRSLDAFERARRLHDSLDALADKGLLLIDTAGAYLELNLYAEALAAYQNAHDVLRHTGMVHDRARALWGMGSTLIARSEFEEAENALAEAAELFEAANNVPLLSGVMLEQAALQEARGDHGAAVATARRALGLVSGTEWSVQRVYAHLRLADLLLPDAAEAESHLLEARRLAERLALPHLRFRLNERLGSLRRLQGRDEEARVLLEAAVDEIERLRGTVAHETMRASFLRDKTTAYEELLKLHLARGGEEGSRSAFAIAERAKSRALVDLLTGVVKELAIPPDDAVEGRIRDLQSDLNVTYTRMLGGTDDDGHGTPLPDLRGRAVELESEISQLRLRAAATSDLFAPPAASDSLEHPPSDVTLVAYHLVGDEIVTFFQGQGGIRIVRNPGSAATVARLVQQLDVQWDRLGAGREFVEQHMTLLERSTRRVLTSLYRELIAPLEPLLDEAVDPTSEETGASRKLVIVPHGLLHRVPFHALFDGGSYLLERFEVSYAPSAKVYALCQKRIPRGFDKALVLSVADPSIPAVAEETQAVVRHLPAAELLSDRQATVEALRLKAPGCGILHLACHGMFRADNPMFSALKLYDGWLAASDVIRLDLAGALVTLSACESGRNEIFAGDELMGLTRAFLGAGATTLVASLWLVQDDTTAELMETWYEHLRKGVGRATALRYAQLALKERWSHPYYWAPFVMIGHR
ncbi:MAG TPA: CHAT domain-containing protein [Rubrobacteraceae bacterium]|nr:CHAT domain-containing protein [Rubrobacteraceae bacterium]